MPLDLSKLQNAKTAQNGARTFGCPACMEQGADHSRDHLILYPDGRFGCIAHQQDEAHRKRIWALAGDGSTEESFSSPNHSSSPIEIERTWDAKVLDRLIKDHSYWLSRGVKEKVLIPLRGGVATEGQLKQRYVIPVFNERDDLVGFTGRTLVNAAIRHKHIGKVSSWVWGGLDEIRESGQAILVEGVGCRLGLASHNIPNSLVLWGTNISQAVLGFLLSANVKDIVIATNNDVKHEVGQQAAIKIKGILDLFFDSRITRICLPPVKDFLEPEMTEEKWEIWKKTLDSGDNDERMEG